MCNNRAVSDSLHRARRRSWTALPPLSEPPATVLDYLVERFPRVDRQVWIDRMRRGLVHGVDGANAKGAMQAITAETAYRPYLRVAYFREIAEQPTVTGREKILFEDEIILVVDKPPFLPVTPSGPYVSECLLYRLEDQLGLANDTSQLAAAHRLDRETRGLVLIVKQREHRGAYARLFAERKIAKTYHAWCHAPEPLEGEHDKGSTTRRLEHRLVDGDPWFLMRTIEGQANALTEIEMLERRGNFVRLALHPLTGKQHQLRVQLAETALPIVGDRFYPRLQPKVDDDTRPPLQLLARELSFVDPMTNEPRHVVSDQQLEDPESLDLDGN